MSVKTAWRTRKPQSATMLAASANTPDMQSTTNVARTRYAMRNKR